MSRPDGVGPAIVVTDVAELLRDHRPGPDFDGVVRVASGVDRLGYAFAVGYDAALHQMVPEARGVTALAATENKSAHPRDIMTRVSSDGLLTGEKSFVTLGNLADTILVVARTEAPQADGRPDLRLVSVAANAKGVTREALRPTPFAPELPHARVRFEGAQGEVMPGDGYALYMKPFRTIEDTWVHIALIAWLIGMASRDAWGDAYIDEARSGLAASSPLLTRDLTTPEAHIALGGLIDRSRALVEKTAFSEARAAEKAMFERDKAILWVAEKARTERLSKARAAKP